MLRRQQLIRKKSMSFHMAQLCPDPFLPSGQDFLSSPVHALKHPKFSSELQIEVGH